MKRLFVQVAVVGGTFLTFTSPLAAQTATAADDAQECYTRQDLSARTNGFVARVVARDGEQVRKGQVLAELDNRLPKAAVREAEAGVAVAKSNLSLARDAFQRLKKMAGGDTVAPQELFHAEMKVEQARAGLAQSEAVLDRQRVHLEDSYIKADIDGRVSGLPNVKNLFVQAGQSLGRIEAAPGSCK